MYICIHRQRHDDDDDDDDDVDDDDDDDDADDDDDGDFFCVIKGNKDLIHPFSFRIMGYYGRLWAYYGQFIALCITPQHVDARSKNGSNFHVQEQAALPCFSLTPGTYQPCFLQSPRTES